MSKKNIFAKFQDYVNKPKRNVFDLSFANNITTKFGQLTPVFCKECIPGDSFKIHSRFALQMMPMKFPVQTPMRAYLHFFYVRNRTLYKDWMDFIGGTKDNLTLPYVQPTDKKKFYRVGGLADYLGVPNTLYSSESDSTADSLPIVGASQNVTLVGQDEEYVVSYSPLATTSWVDYNFFHYLSFEDYSTLYGSDLTNAQIFLQAFVQNAFSQIGGTTAFGAFQQLNPNVLPNPYNAVRSMNYDVTDINKVRYIPWQYLGSYDSSRFNAVSRVRFYTNTRVDTVYHQGDARIAYITVIRNFDNTISQILGNFSTLVYDSENSSYSFEVPAFSTEGSKVEIYILQKALTRVDTNDANKLLYLNNNYVQNSSFEISLGVPVDNTTFSVIGDGSLSETPYDSDIHLNALPFRAYEAIYNSYYRNAQNNPYILNNVPEYNKYIPSYDGGADTNDYDLHQRNWEFDFLTSAVQTPQQGDIAPLVGISVTGEATFQDENGNTYYASAQYDDNGNITGWTSHSPNMPQGSLRLLMDMAGTGISINDLRNVNAFQKFLENNIRRGLKYRDQIKSHFGVDVRYDELDMPEFIGGCSTDVSINKLSQTSESGNTPLGSFVGQASAYGESKHDITHYCDEHGFIIGILSIVPVPVYSQLLPKFFLKSEQLDYFFPEFGHIGYQPILQKEVSPLQTYYSANDLNKVFGYQRSWYDYLDSTDEVHGQFRTTMRDFIMNRTFEDEPELSRDFLLVDPDQLNDVFLAGTDDDIYAPEADKIIGSLYFNVSKKSPIPLFGIPRLD